MSIIIIILTGILPFFKKSPPQPPPQPSKPPEEPGSEASKRRLLLYRTIIERHQGLIEEAEDKSVQELRKLIKPENPAVRKLRDQILEGFRPYIYDRDFPKAAEAAYLFCKDRIANEHLPVDFWLGPEDILEIGAADEIDKTILLCSLLIALENSSAKVVVETQGSTRHAFVIYEFGGKFFFLDPTHSVHVSGTREAVIVQQIKDREQKVIYEFNDTEYREW